MMNRNGRVRAPAAALLAGVLLAMLAFAPAHAQDLGILSSLDLETGVRALGMGGAFVGLADDESAAFANPAGLAGLRAMAFDAYVEKRFGAATLGSVVFGGRNFGGGALFLSLKGIDGRDDAGEATGPFSYSQMAAFASVGATLRDLSLSMLRTPAIEELGFGLRLQIYRVSTLADGNGMGLSLSPSVLFAMPLEGMTVRLGALVENLVGLGVRYGSGHVESWRLGARIGASATFAEGLTLAMELESNGIFHLGGEYRFAQPNLNGTISGFAVRAGTILLRGGPMLTLGLGVGFQQFEVNYAFTSHPELPDSHRLSFTARFSNQTLICLFTGFHEVGICDP